jgi:hypothetical protein
MSTATRGHMRWLPQHETPQHETPHHETGYAAVYEALVAVLIGVIFYAFLKAWRERDGQVAAPVEASPIEGSPIEASPGAKGAAR